MQFLEFKIKSKKFDKKDKLRIQQSEKKYFMDAIFEMILPDWAIFESPELLKYEISLTATFWYTLKIN